MATAFSLPNFMEMFDNTASGPHVPGCLCNMCTPDLYEEEEDIFTEGFDCDEDADKYDDKQLVLAQNPCRQQPSPSRKALSDHLGLQDTFDFTPYTPLLVPNFTTWDPIIWVAAACGLGHRNVSATDPSFWAFPGVFFLLLVLSLSLG